MVHWAVPTSPTASPPAVPTRSSTCGANERRNVAIVSAYNDMLSAHQPLERYPAILKKAVLQAGGVAQFAGGVPAMCDGITQGRAGMELSLFSRDVVAMSTAVALSHDMFDAALMLGVCDKIVPGLLIGALSFGHLPTVFVPAGPMPSGLPEHGEEPHPPAQRRGQGRPRRAAGGRVGVLPLRRHLHLLRHRELQPARARGDGPAPAGRELRQPRHAAAARPDRARGSHRAGRPPRSASSSTRRWSSTASSRCSRPAAPPTTRCTSWPPRPRPASPSRGTTSPTCPRTSRRWPACTPTAPPTSTTSTPRAACRS